MHEGHFIGARYPEKATISGIFSQKKYHFLNDESTSHGRN